MKEQRELPAGWRWAKLREVSELNPRRPAITRADVELTTFIPMEAVDALTGTVTGARARPYGEIKKGYTYFEDGDVLFAKITPCMQNGKHAIARGLKDGFGFGTTEFHVLRPSPAVIAEYVWFYLRQPRLLEDATEHFTGAVGQQRLPEDYLAGLNIPLPPLAEQQRIAAELRAQMAAVEQARAAATQQLQMISLLPPALLREVFWREGRLSPPGWRRTPLAGVVDICSGQVDPKDDRFRDLPHVNGETIESGTGRLLSVRSAAEDGMTSGKYLFGPGVVLYSKLRPYLRKATVADFRGLCSADMYPLTPNPDALTARFLLLILLSDDFTSYAETESARARMPKLNRDQLLAYSATIPPVEDQQQIVERYEKQAAAFAAARSACESQLAAVDALPAALLRRAFGRSESR